MDAGDTAGGTRSIAEALSFARRLRKDSSRPSVFLAIAKAQAKAGVTEGAARTISEALSVARAIGRDFSRARAFADIAEIQVELLGDIPGATQTVTEALAMAVKGKIYSSLVIGKIAEVYATIGDLDTAMILARRVGDAVDRVYVFCAVAQVQAEAGDAPGAARSISEALSIARGMNYNDGWRASYVLSLVAEAQAAIGDIRGAMATARETTVSLHRANALSAIAEAQFQAGDPTGAERSTSQAFSAASRSTDDLRIYAFSRIARAQAANGDFDGAMATARRYTDEVDSVRRSVALKQIASGDLRGALSTGRRINDDRIRVSVLADVAVAQISAQGHVQTTQARSTVGSGAPSTVASGSTSSASAGADSNTSAELPSGGCRALMRKLELDTRAVMQAMEEYDSRNQGAYGLGGIGNCDATKVGYIVNMHSADAWRRCPEADPTGEQLEAIEKNAEQMAQAAETFCEEGLTNPRQLLSMQELLDRLNRANTWEELWN